MTETEHRTIRLFWEKDDLFAAVCGQTAYNARTMTSDKGESLFDQYAMTEDERPFFDDRLYAAFTELQRRFRRIIPDRGKHLDEESQCSITIVARLSGEGHRLYSDHDLQELDRASAAMLCDYVLREWYVSVGLADWVAIYSQKLMADAGVLAELLFRFYRPESRPSYEVEPWPGHSVLSINLDGGKA